MQTGGNESCTKEEFRPIISLGSPINSVDGNAEISFFNFSDGIEIVANRRALHLKVRTEMIISELGNSG
jgi:hypothetical protein